MKPKRIILIRHGQSEANVDQYLFSSKPDYTIELTEKGREQAIEAGKQLHSIVGSETMHFYVSPFWRTRSTFEGVASAFPRAQFQYSEEPRLREQEWGYLRTREEFDRVRQERFDYGLFYYRTLGGESGADVYDRIDDLLGSLFRDFRYDDFPENCILITHGLAIKLFIMRFFHLSVEEFEVMLSPKNCGLVVLEQNADGYYELKTEMLKSEKPLKFSRPIKLKN